MKSSSDNWILIFGLAISCAFWLATSSVTADAVHILAKESFSWRAFGSVSTWLIVVGFMWTVCVSYMIDLRLSIKLKKQVLLLLSVGVWIGFLIIFTALGDQALENLGPFALVVWLIEVGFAVVLIDYLIGPVLRVENWKACAWKVIIALTWLTASKITFLFLSPGVIVRS